MKIRLEISHGQASVRNIALGPDSTIGRSSSCSLRIAANVVSRRHCRIHVAGSDVFLRDLNSSNGTFIDGQRIPPDQDVSLPAGCELSIGGIVFTVQYDPPTPVVQSHESTIEIQNLGDTASHDPHDLPEKTPAGVQPEDDGQEVVGTADNSADDDGAVDRDTDYDPAAVSDDTALAEPDESAAPEQPAACDERPPAAVTAQDDTEQDIGFQFLAEAETDGNAEHGSNPGDDDALGDFLNQL